MAIWDKVKQELDRAGRVAQDAIDEGRIRIDANRVRGLADRAAQALGYAVYRAREAGTPLDDSEIARYSATLAEHEAEAKRLDAQLSGIESRWHSPTGRTAGAYNPPTPSAAGDAPPSTTATPAPPEASAPPPPPPPPDGPLSEPWRPAGDGPTDIDPLIRP